MIRTFTFVMLSMLLLSGCGTCPFKSDEKDSLSKQLTGNTLVGKDYATYFPSDSVSIMNWQGKTSQRQWWIDAGQFCHKSDDGEVCEQVKQLADDSDGNSVFEFCGRWGCFPATLMEGDAKGLGSS